MEHLNKTGKQTFDKIASRYDNRSGYDLIDYREVALPFYKIILVTLFQVRKPIPPIEEFILKSIDIGLNSLEDISGFLGLDSKTTLDAMSNLRVNENIDLISNNEGLQVWKLTKKGSITLEESKILVPDERTVPFYFDGLLRCFCNKKPYDLLKPREVRDKGILEISPSPTRPPELAELDPKEADEIVRQLEKQSKRKKEQDLISFKLIERRERFYQPSLALIYN